MDNTRTSRKHGTFISGIQCLMTMRCSLLFLSVLLYSIRHVFVIIHSKFITHYIFLIKNFDKYIMYRKIIDFHIRYLNSISFLNLFSFLMFFWALNDFLDFLLMSKMHACLSPFKKYINALNAYSFAKKHYWVIQKNVGDYHFVNIKIFRLPIYYIRTRRARLKSWYIKKRN